MLLVLGLVAGYFASQLAVSRVPQRAPGLLSWLPMPARFACYAAIFYLAGSAPPRRRASSTPSSDADTNANRAWPARGPDIRAIPELYARLDDYISYGAPMWGVYNAENLYVRDAIGKRGLPHARFRKWGLNALGYRGPDLIDGRPTVVCFGASETFGQQEREGSEYPRQLERELNARAGAQAYQVLNAAYAGQTVRTATLRVPEFAAMARPVAALIYGVPASYIEPPPLDAPPVPPGRIEQPRFELRIVDRVRTLLKGMIPASVQTWLRTREISADRGAATAVARLPEANIQRYRDDLSKLIVALRQDWHYARPRHSRGRVRRDALGQRPGASDKLAQVLSDAAGRRLPRHGAPRE